MKKAIVLLEHGDEQNSVDHFVNLLRAVGDNKNSRISVLYWMGVAYLRLAERNNCVKGHSSEACIMPIKGSGVHKDESASRQAIETFTAYLTEAGPKDENYWDGLWLLNVCYMTVGEYPLKVPSQWLLPGLDAADYPMRPMIDIAGDLKILVNNRAGGCIVEDFDNDGFLDIVTSAWDLKDPMHYFRNNGGGTFSDLSEQSGLKAFGGGLNIQQTDYNNDGYPDIWVLREAWQGISGTFGDQPNSLLRNNKDGTFSDVTIEAGLLSFHPTQTSTWNDFNNDGWLDVFIGNETSPGKNRPCELFLNNQDGTFKNVAQEIAVNISLMVKGVASGDYNNDGWADIFLSTMDGRKVLMRNDGLKDGKLSFKDVTEEAGLINERYRSFPTFFFDYDNDGWLDLFVCNYEFERTLSHYAAKDARNQQKDIAGKPRIYRNNGNGTFADVTKQMNIDRPCFAMGANFGDLNNDGFLDIYLGTGNPQYQSIVPNRLFMNVGGQKFAEATNNARVGHLQKGHGISFADLDNDGDQDIYTDLGGAYQGDAYPSAFYLNPGQNNNRWIYLKLEGTKSNRAAIGAKITLKFRENGISRMVYREVNSGGSFGSSPFRREIGIGQADIIDEIVVYWPMSSTKQTFRNIKPNQLILITEGEDKYKTGKLQQISFRKADGSMPMCAPTVGGAESNARAE